MTAHDRKALLRAFYGLLFLWLINGVFGLLRAAGPGALLPYIEVGLLLVYWLFVFNWWRSNRPKAISQAVRKSQRVMQDRSTNREIERAVDREEAISKERNRRRKKWLKSSVYKSLTQVSGALYRFRLGIIGIAAIIVISVGLQGYQAIARDMQRREDAQAREVAESERQAEVRAVVNTWRARNACAKTELEARWREWYINNPQTQVQEYFSTSKLKMVKAQRVLPVPDSLDDISLFGPPPLFVLGEKPTVWVVTQSHFKPLIGEIQDVCLDLNPPPPGLTDADMSLDSYDLLLIDLEDSREVWWRSPFPNSPF